MFESRDNGWAAHILVILINHTVFTILDNYLLYRPVLESGWVILHTLINFRGEYTTNLEVFGCGADGFSNWRFRVSLALRRCDVVFDGEY